MKTKQPLKKLKIPNSQISQVCGLSPQYIGQLLAGKRKNPESLELVHNSIQQIAEELTKEYTNISPKKKVA